MSKRNSTQSGKFSEKLLGKWASFCVKRPQPVLTCLFLFSMAGYIAAWLTWFPYVSPVSQLPKNFDERLAWEETSRQTQFNAEIMLRVSISDSDASSSPGEGIFSSRRHPSPKQRLAAAVDQLKGKLSGSRNHFCDVLSSLNIQAAQTRELCELSHDELQMLYAELLDARIVLGGRWSLLESANYADWLTSRLQQAHDSLVETPVNRQATQTALLQNRRLIEAAALFTEGLHQNLSRPSAARSPELVSPWQLNPDKLFAKTDSQSPRPFETNRDSADRISGNPTIGLVSPVTTDETIIVWAKLAEPQLTALLDRRVIGKVKKVDHKLVKKLDASLSELNRIVEDVARDHDGVIIESFGVPVDVQHSRALSPVSQLTGVPIVLAALLLFFIAGIRHIRVYTAVFLSTVCSLGIYLGFTAIWFEMITPLSLFTGIAATLFGVCAGIIQATAWVDARRRDRSASEAVVEMMRTSGKSVFRGGLISLTVFLAGVFYLWFLPFEPTALTVSFRASLIGINLVLFLLAQAVLACLCGSLGALPALIRVLAPEGRGVSFDRSRDSERPAFDPFKTIPTIPQAVNVVLTVALLGCCLYFISRQKTPDDQSDPYVTRAEKQAAAMPILISQRAFEQCDRREIPGLFACDASALLAGNDTTKAVVIDNMSRIVDHTSEQQKITLSDQNAIQRSLIELHRQLARQFTALQKTIASENPPPESVSASIRLCRQAGDQINAICRLLPQLSPAQYYERVDAWQQAVASDLVIQQKRLQARLNHNRSHRGETSVAVTRRFLDADRQPIVWLFPAKNGQTQAHREQLQRVFVPLLSGEMTPGNAHKTTARIQPDVFRPQCGGFPLLALSGRQLVRQQLPPLGAVMLAALLLPILLAHRSVPIGAMTILIVAAGLSIYGISLTLLGLSFDRVTVFPIVFFPLVLPLFLDMFRRRNASVDHFRANLGVIIVCFGVGIVVVGYLMFSRDAVLFTAGRVMILGWVALMLPLLVNLVSVLKPEKTDVAAHTPATLPSVVPVIVPQLHPPELSAVTSPEINGVAQIRVVQENQSRDSHGAVKPIDDSSGSDENDHVVPARPDRVKTTSSDQPTSLAPRDQLDFYRERIEAAQVFDKRTVDADAPVDAENDNTPIVESDAAEHVLTETQSYDDRSGDFETPAFPAVWSVGTKRRPAQTVVAELRVPLAVASSGETVVSVAARSARQTSEIGKTKVTARVARSVSVSIASQKKDSDVSPTILPIRRQATDNDSSIGYGDDPPTTDRRKLG